VSELEIKDKEELKTCEEEKPKDCFECVYFGENGEHILSGKAHFPSLCEKDWLWFNCNGEYGVRKGNE